MTVVCLICGQPVDPNDQRAYRRVQGWERKRRSGGANQITLREVVPGVLAHDVCISLARKRIDAGQGTLF